MAEPPRGDDATTLQLTPTAAAPNELEMVPPADRYVAEGTLGEGGMGIVRVCRDKHLDRHVAMKVVRAPLANDAQALARFLREARVQGRLEHPAVVPVYDLGLLE